MAEIRYKATCLDCAAVHWLRGTDGMSCPYCGGWMQVLSYEQSGRPNG